MNSNRYAIYFMPDGALGNFGASWLGWDPRVGARVPFLDLEGIDRELVALTKAPGKYGLHATLKPPFQLRTPHTETELILRF